MPGYAEDLAYIHDVGFSGYVSSAAPELLDLLRRNGIAGGLVVDLGCGGGRWARMLTREGYEVLGIDQSPHMIRLARRNAPRAEFRVGSLLREAIPRCDAVTSIGECLNYLFDADHGKRAMARFFRRVLRALRPGGVFVFDIAGPGRIPANAPVKNWMEGKGWAVLVETSGDAGKRLLERRIVSFRKVGARYRRSEELHRLRLYDGAEMVAELEAQGFRVERMPGFGGFRLLPGMEAFLARKE
jgi:SAM-dependent methyltransferase